MKVWPYLNSLFMIKLPFLSKNMSKFSPLLSPSKTCALPFDFTLEQDPKNIFYYQCNVENYTDQVLNFLLFDGHEYIMNLAFCNSGQYTYVMSLCNFFLCSSRFDWQNQFLFPENSFSEELASCWLLILYITRFFQCK